MIKFNALLASLTLLMGLKATAAPVCSDIFANPLQNSITALAELKIRLDSAKAEGQNSIEMTVLQKNYIEKENELAKHFESRQIMTRENLLTEIKSEIVRIQKDKKKAAVVSEKETERETRERQRAEKVLRELTIDGRIAVFGAIEPGTFMMGAEGIQTQVTLTKPFEMMATLTTQVIWKKIAELINLKKSLVDPSYFKGETRPVESLKKDEIQLWINELNELSKHGYPELAEIIRGHQRGDVYRLPTEAEWEFVIKGRGTSKDYFYYGNDRLTLDEYAWYDKNSSDQTHPVAKKKPLIIDGKEFYDMHGNVAEFVLDDWTVLPSGGTDPLEKGSGDSVVRSGSYNDNWGNQRMTDRQAYSDKKAIAATGFRLVREVRSLSKP